MDTFKEIIIEYNHALRRCLTLYLDKWVRHSTNRKRIGPGLVERVDMSLREAICTVRWANDEVTMEYGRDLEMLS